jgi:hypothetical protein
MRGLGEGGEAGGAGAGAEAAVAGGRNPRGVAGRGMRSHGIRSRLGYRFPHNSCSSGIISITGAMVSSASSLS